MKTFTIILVALALAGCAGPKFCPRPGASQPFERVQYDCEGEAYQPYRQSDYDGWVPCPGGPIADPTQYNCKKFVTGEGWVPCSR